MKIPAGHVAGLLDEARFSIPEHPSTHVQRAHVAAMLAESRAASVVLVSAPAGTGKTSAVAAWARSQPHVGWVTFERKDDSFWGPVLRCLSGLGLPVPGDWRVLGQSRLGGPRLIALGQILAESPWRATLVLDGLRLDSRKLGDELDALVRQAQGQLRIVLVARVDPLFPFYRYAVQDSMVEIRGADLVMNDAEAAEVLRLAGVVIDPPTVHALNRRLGGWPVGLHLAARAVASRTPAELSADYVDVVTGEAGPLDEFLVAEVLDHFSPEVRRAALDAAVPDVLCQDLVEDLVGPAAAHAFGSFSELRCLVEPESGRPGWFRYPPFLRDLLRVRLAYESPDRMAAMQRRTADWLRRAGRVTDALAHLAEVGAWDDVVDEIIGGLRIGQMLLEGPDGPLTKLARHLPADVPDAGAAVLRAAVALSDLDRHRCQKELERARSALGGEEPSDQLRLAVTLVDALVASRAGDVSIARELAGEAERGLMTGLADEAPTQASQLYCVAVVSKGYVALRHGDLIAALEALSLATQYVPSGMGAWFRADCLAHVAVAEALRGNLDRAARAAEEALECAEIGSIPPDQPPVVGAQVALATVALERDDVDFARALVDAARPSVVGCGDTTIRALFLGCDAVVGWMAGEGAAARQRLAEASGGLAPRDPWLADHLRLCAARRCVADGDVVAAAELLEALYDGDRSEALVVALACSVERGDEDLETGLDRLPAIETLALSFRVSALLLQSYCLAERSSPGRSRSALGAALALARPEALRGPFRDVGPTLSRWLEGEQHFRRTREWLAPQSAGELVVEAGEAIGLAVEPLTVREREVLGHLEDLLTTQEIAAKMFVSVNTVRTHIRSVLRKLGVNRRNAAIRRARELGILPSQG